MAEGIVRVAPLGKTCSLCGSCDVCTCFRRAGSIVHLPLGIV